MKTTNGLTVLLDPGDEAWAGQWHWYAKWSDSSKTWYVYRLESTIRRGKRWQRKINLSRALLGLKPNDKRTADHQGHDGLDCRRSTGALRIATRSEQARNRRTRVDNLAGYKGVSLDPSCPIHPYRSQIWVGTNLEIGRFDSAREAAIWYNLISGLTFGKFACFNEIVK